MTKANENAAEIVLLFSHSSEFISAWVTDESRVRVAIPILAPESPQVWAFYAVKVTAYGSKAAIRQIKEAEAWPRGGAIFLANAEFLTGRLIDPRGVNSEIWSISAKNLRLLVKAFCSEHGCIEFNSKKNDGFYQDCANHVLFQNWRMAVGGQPCFRDLRHEKRECQCDLLELSARSPVLEN